ncbi:MAG: BamA/TamA family outer membrane protein, partial [Ignavibacteriae bacterium]|nr:BamA/TamA family outer membrane protein [Ignavibacteriota bacterium]
LSGFPIVLAQQEFGSESEVAFEINKIEFQGNETFDDDELKNVIQSAETPSGFSKFLYRTFGEKLGSKPEYFDPETFSADRERLQAFYRDNGFYLTVIEGKSIVDTSGQAIDLLFIIQENKRSYIDSIAYEGLDDIPEELTSQLFKESLIYKGMPYETGETRAEINRVVRMLADHGYPVARFDGDSSKAYHQRFTSNNFFLVMKFIPGSRYLFGNVRINMDPPRRDITENIFLRQLDFQTGEIYSRNKTITSERNINRLGLFETARLEHLNISDSAQTSSIPIQIYARPRPRHELSPELIVSDENNALNFGVGLGYTIRNFLGDARIFNTRARARTQSIRELLRGDRFRDTTIIGGLDLEFSILQPYLFTRLLSGSWTTNLSIDKQNLYILSILRNKVGLSYHWATYSYAIFEWTLERVNPEILDPTLRGSILPTLREEEQPQFNSIFTLTLQRDKTNDIFSPTEGFFNSMTLEESGSLPKLIPALRGELPFTQYYKITLFGRWYRDLTSTRYNILALKAKAGYQNKYGASRFSDVRIPLNRRFFSGGSGSVRGWKARELGAMPDSLLPLGGNFILEGNVEMRIHYLRGYPDLGFIKLNNIWGVYFIDFGNVWDDIKDFKPRDISIAAGIGFRYETIFGPFRIDYGFRMYDPKEEVGRQTVFQKRFFGETLSDGVFHFGIGHAF